MMDHYNPEVVVLSFSIAFLGSYMAISMCEQYRQCRIGLVESRHVPTFAYLGIMAVCLGGVGIWCMHFIGMSAVVIYDGNDQQIDVRFDIGLTILSLILVLAFSLLGFYISSHDQIFMKTKRQIVELLIEDTASLTFRDIGAIKPTQILWIMGTHFPQHLLGGGLCTGSGVVVMHYVGMAAMRFPGTIVWNKGIIAASIIIAFAASTAAFWILFRLLSMYANKENLRLACAFTMAVAVCGMHYVGMVAANFKNDPSIKVNLGSTISTYEVFISGLLAAGIAGIVGAIIVLSDLRYSVSKLIVELSRADQMMMNMPVASSGGCANTVQKYLSKRKCSNFNLGVINQTMVFEGDHDDNSSSNSYHSGSHSHSHHGGRNLTSISQHRTEHQHPHQHHANSRQIHPASKYELMEEGIHHEADHHGDDDGNPSDAQHGEHSPTESISPPPSTAKPGTQDDGATAPLTKPRSLRIKVARTVSGSDKTTITHTAISTASMVDSADFVLQDVLSASNLDAQS